MVNMVDEMISPEYAALVPGDRIDERHQACHRYTSCKNTILLTLAKYVVGRFAIFLGVEVQDRNFVHSSNILHFSSIGHTCSRLSPSQRPKTGYLALVVRLQALCRYLTRGTPGLE